MLWIYSSYMAQFLRINERSIFVALSDQTRHFEEDEYAM